ncbi:RHS repeat domain-containing protein [Flavobacterium sp. HNIBRBA15423]|uniref:RHS repeat domain-containing protein n=1 Tax=Flavobacterium sp. HNIBRBA15423 TaxID=3458683 RepID=UPI004043C2FF
MTETGIKTQTDYLAGGFQYKVNELQFFPHPEGYVNVIDDKYNYVFNYTDHLGNIRVSYGVDPSTSTLKILEENHYYPFGLKHEGYNMDYKTYQKIQSGAIAIRLAAPLQPNYLYKYNGAELQTELGLNMYDMDMRDYDPAIARWVAQDPVVHYDYSPYSAFDNNPVFWSDPSGADSETDIFGRNRFDNNGIYIPAIDRGKSNQNIGIDEIAVESLKQTAKLYMDGEDMSNLNESQKQKIFKKDALKTIGILLWEFATGTGNESRTFEKGIHPFADDLISGRIIKEIITEFSEKAALDGYDFTMKGDSETYKIALEFSPNSSPSTWMNSLIKHIDSNAVQFFVGGAIATVGVKNNNLIIQIYNETSRNSLMLHIGGNYDRKNGNKSLSTIKQYINASYEISRN